MRENGWLCSNDAELYFRNRFNNMGMYSEGYGSVLAAAQLRLTTFSAINGYLDQNIYADSCMNMWKRLPVTKMWLKNNNFPVDSVWFKTATAQQSKGTLLNTSEIISVIGLLPRKSRLPKWWTV